MINRLTQHAILGSLILAASVALSGGCGSDDSNDSSKGNDSDACAPKTCAELGKTCGTLTDGCGNSLVCGNCPAPQLCRPDNTCCSPTSCEADGKDCGSMPDGCGASIECGSCTNGLECGGGNPGVANVCGNGPCTTQTTCAAEGKNCGVISDGCGKTLDCGACSGSEICGNDNVCASGGTGGSGGSGGSGGGGSGGTAGAGGATGGTGGSSTGCVVNWLDPLAYDKPACVTLHQPDEATVTNKYWIDLSNGSGSNCTEQNPCGSFDDVVGKPGTNGGPAIIYVKGTGSMSWYNDTVRGSGDFDCRATACPDWILIRTWPAGSPGCASECTATIMGNSNMNSQDVHHIMWDGGPDLKIRFQSNGNGTYAQNINSNWHIVYRTQTFCTGSNNGVLGFQVGSTTVASNVKFINNELHSCDQTGDQASAIYVGPGTGGGYMNFVIQNNIVRDWGGEGIEVNPRVTSSDMLITGNAIHHNGFVTCSTGWACRPGIVMSVQSGGGNNGTVITNNLIWDHASGCIWDRGGGTPAAQIANNTCYDYGKGSDSGGPNPQGISGYGGPGKAIIRNNVLFAPNGTNPFNGSYAGATNNACASGESCGAASKTWSASGWLSTSPASGDFLAIGAASAAHDNGTSIGFVTSDYLDVTRPQGSGHDIGAFEYDE